jgi:hypothetical protein
MSYKPLTRYVEPETLVDQVKPFDGKNQSCKQLLSQLRVVFATYPKRFSTDRSKVLFLLSHLEGAPLDWATVFIDQEDLEYEKFSTSFLNTFQEKESVDMTLDRLALLKQEGKTVQDYVLEFKSISSTIPGDNLMLIHAFKTGLSSDIKDELVHYDPPNTLSDMIELVKRVELRISSRAAEKKQEALPKDSSVSRSNRSSSESSRLRTLRTHWKAKGFCLSCGGADHVVASCPVKRPIKSPKGQAQSTQ